MSAATRLRPDTLALQVARRVRTGMAKMSGRITLVQESRFVLTDPAGISHLFTLSPHAGAEPSQLPPLAARQAKVEVTYGEVQNMITSLATRIDLLDETAAEPAL